MIDSKLCDESEGVGVVYCHGCCSSYASQARSGVSNGSLFRDKMESGPINWSRVRLALGREGYQAMRGILAAFVCGILHCRDA